MKKKQLHLTRQDKRQVSIKDQRPKIKVSLVSIDITRRLVSISTHRYANWSIVYP